MLCSFTVCISVCQQLYIKAVDCIFVKVLRHVSVEKEELIKFWKSSRSRSRNYLKDIQHCELGHFSAVWLISLEKLVGSL